jgi:hypothetical protein
MESHGGMILTGENRRTRRKACPTATLSTTNPTWFDPDNNPDLHDERSGPNRLSHGILTYLLITLLLYWVRPTSLLSLKLVCAEVNLLGEVEGRLNSANSCNYSVWDIFFSHLLSKMYILNNVDNMMLAF